MINDESIDDFPKKVKLSYLNFVSYSRYGEFSFPDLSDEKAPFATYLTCGGGSPVEENAEYCCTFNSCNRRKFN